MQIRRLLAMALLAGCAVDEPTESSSPPEPTLTATGADDITPAQRASELFRIAEQTRDRAAVGPSETLEEYAAKCDAAVGLHVPSFNCDVGTEVPGQGTVPAGGACEAPNVLNHQCDPGSKFQVLAQNSDAAVVAHCRKVGLAAAGSTYNDIAVIQYNKANGAVCFYQALTNLPGANVRAPSEGLAAWKWFEPWRTHNIGCVGCHDSGGFVRSPYLRQLTAPPNVLPSVSAGFTNLDSPLHPVGNDWANDRTWSLTAPAAPCPAGQSCTPCNSCHRLAANNVRPSQGTAGSFAVIATAMTQDSKFAHSPSSPIWMRPGQTYWNQEAELSARNYANCAAGFVASGFAAPPAGCTATPLATAYASPINGWARGDDLAILGSTAGGAQLTVGFSNDNGSFAVTNTTADFFAGLARIPGVQRLAGDFNKDGRTDFALVGGPGWNTIPVAFSQGDGTFSVTNFGVGPDFNNWSRSGAKLLVGDYNKDGYSDIAVVGGPGWNTVPVAFAAGGGTWQVTNSFVGSFGAWATSGAKPIVGDFNKDGYSDIALVGGPGWTSIPVAFAAGGGSWQVTNGGAGSFPSWTTLAGAQVLVGDFNKDGYSDFAVTGVAGWTQIPIAFAAGGGNWQITQFGAPGFASLAAGARATVGDFNRDGYSDIALTGNAGWQSIPIAFAAGGGSWQTTNGSAPSFGPWASTAGVRTIAGDFNGDGYTDLALTGASWWGSVPVALATGGGNWSVVNAPATFFPGAASDPTATIVAGRFN